MTWAEIGTLFGMLTAVVVILLLAWLFTRYLAGRTPGAMRFSRNRDGRLQLLERMPLGREQYLAVVRAGETVSSSGCHRQSNHAFAGAERRGGVGMDRGGDRRFAGWRIRSTHSLSGRAAGSLETEKEVGGSIT